MDKEGLLMPENM